MGRKDAAIREGRRAVELKPESKDASDGTIMNCYLTLIYARGGENNLAIPLIDRLLRTPGTVDSADYSITVNHLKLRWKWDPVRNDRRFQQFANANRPITKSSSVSLRRSFVAVFVGKVTSLHSSQRNLFKE